MTSRRAATLCLALIVVQNSSLILVTSYSRTLTPAYLPSVAVCLSEVLKLCAAWCILGLEVGSTSKALQQVSALMAEHSRVTWQFAVPALCYTVQNNLWYYALSNLDPITAAVTSQMKVITTALASVLMLGRRLSLIQWLALFLLTLGMVVMQIPANGAPSPKPTAGRVVPRNTLSGACAMLLSTILSAYAGVFLEKLFKTAKLTLWLQSIQLSIFALPVSCVCMLMYDFHAITAHTLLVGLGAWAWLTVVLSALGGIAVSMALKYADNILKTFAVGCSIVLNCCVSTLFLGVPLTPQVALGVLLVVSSTFLFNGLRAASTRGGNSDAIEDELLSPLNDGADSADSGEEHLACLENASREQSPRSQCASELSARVDYGGARERERDGKRDRNAAEEVKGGLFWEDGPDRERREETLQMPQPSPRSKGERQELFRSSSNASNASSPHSRSSNASSPHGRDHLRGDGIFTEGFRSEQGGRGESLTADGGPAK